MFKYVVCFRIKSYFLLFFSDFAIGMKTNAPEMIIVRINGPSMRWVPVNMMKQMATHNKVKTTLCAFVSGFLIYIIKGMAVCLNSWEAHRHGFSIFSFSFLRLHQ